METINDTEQIINTDGVTENDKEIIETKVKAQKDYYCYILRTDYYPDRNKTYNGFTTRPKNRVRQHNQEITGGARYTKMNGNKQWSMYVLIKGYPDNKSALQSEWKIKKVGGKRRRPAKFCGPEGRIRGLNEVLKLNRWTGNSTKDNSDSQFTVWIETGYAHLLTDLPTNITVIVTDDVLSEYQKN